MSPIDQYISNFIFGKAAGPDMLSAEHLHHAPPTLIIHLKLLFHIIVKHSFVPSDFGQGIIIPVVKERTENLNNVENYRGITLIPIISKLFESVILAICDNILQTDDRQFGFKKKTQVCAC